MRRKYPSIDEKFNTAVTKNTFYFYYTKSDKYKFFDIRMMHKRCRKCQYILQDYGGKKLQMHQFGPLVSDVWTDIHRIRHKSRRDEHPCQLPIHLLERLILMSTDEGDVILDPFVGTGTTAIAAKKLGRRFVGIDIDPTYVKMTESKLEYIKPTVINGCYVSNFLDEVVTIRNKDWDRIKTGFIIPCNPLDLEKEKIYMIGQNHRIRYRTTTDEQKEGLFSLSEKRNMSYRKRRRVKIKNRRRKNEGGTGK